MRTSIVVILAALGAVPAGRADDKLPPPTRAQFVSSQGNLKQIGLAFHIHADDKRGVLPNDTHAADGKGLLSWRVHILPYIEQEALFKEFKHDEPWDSEHNKKLIPKMPKIYAPIRVKAKEGETFYQVFTGEKAVFGPKNKPLMPATFQDGTSHTVLVFEAGEPTVWTKPGDLAFDEKKPLPKLGGLFDGDFNVVMGDGSVMRIGKTADADELKKLIMPADGNVIDFKKLGR